MPRFIIVMNTKQKSKKRVVSGGILQGKRDREVPSYMTIGTRNKGGRGKYFKVSNVICALLSETEYSYTVKLILA